MAKTLSKSEYQNLSMLLDDYIEGDQEALEEACKILYPIVRGGFHKLCTHIDTLNELTATFFEEKFVLCNFRKKKHFFDGVSHHSSYLYLSIKNHFVEFRRKENKHDRKFVNVDIYDLSNPIEDTTSAAGLFNSTYLSTLFPSDVFNLLLDQSGEKNKQILEDFYIAHLPVKQIASNRSLTEPAVKMRLSRGRKKIAEYIKENPQTVEALFQYQPD